MQKNIVTMVKTQYIKNLGAKMCKDCIFYLPDHANVTNANWSKCMKYGQLHIASGNLTYEFADFARYDETKCGAIASDFMKNTQQKLLFAVLQPRELHINLPLSDILSNAGKRVNNKNNKYT